MSLKQECIVSWLLGNIYNPVSLEVINYYQLIWEHILMQIDSERQIARSLFKKNKKTPICLLHVLNMIFSCDHLNKSIAKNLTSNVIND